MLQLSRCKFDVSMHRFVNFCEAGAAGCELTWKSVFSAWTPAKRETTRVVGSRLQHKPNTLRRSFPGPSLRRYTRTHHTIETAAFRDRLSPPWRTRILSATYRDWKTAPISSLVRARCPRAPLECTSQPAQLWERSGARRAPRYSINESHPQASRTRQSVLRAGACCDGARA